MYTSCLCSRLLSVSILKAPIASLVPLPFLKPNSSSPRHLSASALACNLFAITFSNIFEACVSKLMVRYSSHLWLGRTLTEFSLQVYFYIFVYTRDARMHDPRPTGRINTRIVSRMTEINEFKLD